MKKILESFLKIGLLVFIWIVWWLVLKASLSRVVNLSVIAGGVLLTYPLSWTGRKILDQRQTIVHAVRISAFSLHY